MEQEVKCPICLEYLTDPVVLNCGHSFCQGCITNYCDTWEALGDLECPVCKVRFQNGHFCRNWQLANVVEKMKLLPLSSGNKDLCLRHKEKLHLFCKEDEQLVCFVCEHSPEHKGHTVLLLEEAAQQIKDKIFNCLETLESQREKILEYIEDAEDETRNILKRTESQRQKAVAEFKTLHQLLEEQEKHLLAQIEEVEKEVASKKDEHLARLSEELSSLKSLIRDMEEKQQQPVSELLQDVRGTLQRYEKKETFEKPEAFSSGLKWRVHNCCFNPFLASAMAQFKGASQLWGFWRRSDTLDWAFPKQRAIQKASSEKLNHSSNHPGNSSLSQSTSVATGLNLMKKQKVKTVFPHIAGTNKALLSFAQGDTITLLVSEERDGWLYGEHDVTKMKGCFPSSYIKPFEEPVEETVHAPVSSPALFRSVSSVNIGQRSGCPSAARLPRTQSSKSKFHRETWKLLT